MANNFNFINNSLAKIINFFSNNPCFPMNIFIVSSEGDIIWANDRLLAEVKIVEKKSIFGKNISYFGTIAHNGITRVVKTKKEEIVTETYKNNHYVTCRYPVLTEQGNVDYILGVSFNINKIKQAEIAKQDFMKNMAHDLRTPLAGIIGLAQLQASGKIKTNQEVTEYGKMMHGAGSQLLSLLNSVMDFIDTDKVLSETTPFEPILLSKLVEDLHLLLLPKLYAKRLNFNFQIDEAIPVIISDHFKLKHILLNLLSNALKFTEKGSITLRMKLISSRGEKIKIAILIEDTGIGIAKNQWNKIFKQFYRIHSSYTSPYMGSGIGLYLTKKMVTSLGGTIKVTSKEQAGSCFTLNFTFNLAKDSALTQKKNHSVLMNKGKQEKDASVKNISRCVLVAEDNNLALYAIKKLLEEKNYQVETVQDGVSALASMKKNKFSFVILDLGLPSLSGEIVVKRYRVWEHQTLKSSCLPIFILTAHANKKIEAQCEKIGVNYVFCKPLTTDILEKIEYTVFSE